MEENKPVTFTDPQAHSPVRSVPTLPFFPTGKREGIFGVFVVIFSIFLGNCLIYSGANLGFSIALLGSTAAAVVYLWRSGCKGTWYGWILLAMSAVIIPGFVRTDDGFVKFVMSCFLFVAVNLGLCDLAGQTLWSTSSVRSLLDCLRTAFSLGIGRIAYAFRGISIALQSGGTAAKNGAAALLGAVIAIPVLAILIPLLMSADAAFQGLLELLPEFELEEILASLIFGAGLACLTYTRAVALKHDPKVNNNYVNLRKGLNPITVNTVLGAVCAVYAVYLASQLAYFVGGFSGILPEEFTVAEYARRGFFEMAWICVINLTVMILAISFTEKKQGRSPLSIRVLCLFIGIVTLFLVVAAGAKMVLYIGSFGMTRLRVLTMVIMAFLGLTTAVVSVWLFAPKLPYMKIVVLSAMILGAAVLWTDVDSVVAKYNVDSYLSGQLSSVDLPHLKSLGSGAVPHVHRLAQEAPDKITQERATEILTVWNNRVEISDFRDWNYVDAIAEAILEQYKPEA